MVKAGDNINISCPGISELSLISSLEWRCQGCNLPVTTTGDNATSSGAAAGGTGPGAATSGRKSSSIEQVCPLDSITHGASSQIA